MSEDVEWCANTTLFFLGYPALIVNLYQAKNMPYNLVFSRTISSDAVMRIVDVPIPDRSVMIEVLSLISPYRRIAGYAYALRSDGITDYERSSGVTIPFGKNRVNFAAATVPYGLEFFPRWGVRSGIISVYTGEPGSPPPAVRDWRQASLGPYQVRLNVSPPGASYRTNSFDETVDDVMAGAVMGFLSSNYVFWKLSDGTVRYKPIGPDQFLGVGSSEDYIRVSSEPGYVEL